MNYELCGFTTQPMTKNRETCHYLRVNLVSTLLVPKTIHYICNIWPKKYIVRDINICSQLCLNVDNLNHSSPILKVPQIFINR